MSPAALLAFEARWPGNSPSKRERIRRELGVSDIRYYQLLHHAASTPEGIAADPFTARSIRERADRRARVRASRVAS